MVVVGRLGIEWEVYPPENGGFRRVFFREGKKGEVGGETRGIDN